MMSFVRQIAERVLRDRTRLRRLPSDFGSLPIIVSSAGGLGQMLRPLAEVDPDLFATAKALVRAGNTVWDIGANVGLFTVAAAACAGGGGQSCHSSPTCGSYRCCEKRHVCNPRQRRE